MPTNEWLGDAQPVAQTGTLTVGGAPASGNKIRVTMNRKFVEYTFQTADTTALMASGLSTLLQASEIPEFKEVDWTYPGSGSVISYASTNPGQPFELTASATGGGATLTDAPGVAASGPNHADEPVNWSLGTVPADGEDLKILGGSAILYGIDTAFAHDFASVEIDTDEAIGLPFRNAEYVEYRPRYAVFGDTAGCPVKVRNTGEVCNLSLHGGDVVEVEGTGTRGQNAEGIPALAFVVRNGTATTLNHHDGDVGFCPERGQTGTLASVSLIGDAVFMLGEGGNVTSWDMDGGEVDDYGDTTTLGITLGVFRKWDGTLTTINGDGGIVSLNCDLTVTTANFRGQPDGNQIATCDLTDGTRAVTFTNSSFTGGAVLNDPNKRVAFTNPATFDRASLTASDMGARFNVTRS